MVVQQQEEFTSVPVIDIGALVNPSASAQEKQEVAKKIYDACRYEEIKLRENIKRKEEYWRSCEPSASTKEKQAEDT